MVSNRMEDSHISEMEDSLGLCQPQRNNRGHEIRVFEGCRVGSKETKKSKTMTSPTVEVTSLDTGREKCFFEKFVYFQSITCSPCPLLVMSLSLHLVGGWEQVEMVGLGLGWLVTG